jgi:hypothetical protein
VGRLRKFCQFQNDFSGAPEGRVALSDAALKFAHAFVAESRRCFVDGDPFAISTMHAMLRRTCRYLAELHPRNAARIVEFAIHGVEQADEALREMIAERHEHGQPLGATLATYANIIAERPPEHRQPEGRPRENFVANYVVVVLLLELMRQFPMLKLRRNPTSRRPSACSIAKVALDAAGLPRGSEEAIRKIWRDYGPAVVPGYR